MSLVKENNVSIEIPKERWSVFGKEGFHQLRNRWPGVFHFEESALLHEHIMLLEYLDCTKPAAKSFNGDAPKTLVSSLGHIGDIIHAIPMIRRLREKYPDSEIHFVCGPWGKSVVEKYPEIDVIHIWKPQLRMYCRKVEDLNESFEEQLSQLLLLREQAYDLLITCAVTTLSEMILLQAANPARWIGAELNFPLYAAGGEDRSAPFNSLTYEAERLQKLAGFDAPFASITFPSASELPAKWRDVFDSKKVVVIAPTAGWEGKCWPRTYFAELIEKLFESNAADIAAVTGSLEEKEICESLCVHPHAVNLAGELSLEETALLIQQAALFIGNDSAPLHLAASAGAKRIALFGATDPERWTKPDENLIVLRKVDKVAGAFPWHPEAPTQRASEAMAKITVDEVLEAAQKLLA